MGRLRSGHPFLVTLFAEMYGFPLAVRHPQYSGLLLMIVGALIQWPTLLTLVMAPILAATCIRLARREERVMRERFGTAYDEGARLTPAFVAVKR